ncbi:MAG: protein translocase subunit SecD [Gemmatimonadaceae bacterium]|nr:protein translocase subunit SecD [Gemmatimonadaceae bacterium]
MNNNIRNRLLVILVLVVASVFVLWPRSVTVRERNARTGQFHDTTLKNVPLKKGLDLQGGMYLALEVDDAKGVVANKGEAIDRALKVVRNRIDEFGVSEPVVQKVGTDRIVVELPGVDDRTRAEGLVQNSAFLQFQITDKSQAFDKALARLDGVVKQSGGAAVASAGDSTKGASPLNNLFSKSDSGKAKNDSSKGDTTTATATGGPFSKLISPGQMPGEYLVAKTDVPTLQGYLDRKEVQAALPPGKSLHWGSEDLSAGNASYATLYLVDSRPIITGEYLTDAKPGNDPTEGQFVSFTLNNEGGRKFRSETGKHIGDYMAIVLDDRVMGRPPVIQSAIGTRGQITMRGAQLQKTQDLALVLRAGALPVPLKIVESRSIGASLGADSITDGIHAGLAGVTLVVLIMLFYYRFSGMLAVGALLLYLLFTLALLAGLQATLTLPGLAGLVLSVGIALDANVLIFERIREEMVHGKTVRAAIDEGFKHAMSAIIDSNVSTVITALVLYEVGTGPVKGFAVTLMAGIAASMVSSIFVVRTFFLLWLNRTRGAQTLSI